MFEGLRMLLDPVLIAEVLSPITEGYDYGAKFIAYQSIPSFKEYLLIAQDTPQIIQYVKQDNGWLRKDHEGLSGTIYLPSINCKLLLSEVYRGIEFEQASEEQMV
jgi:Uma2 family endonuclease